ncbi:MAG: 3-dehydroquinate synthase [Ruminococcaceae bacterium]|nr:3-dehydroquinate synthase [Oscillospiraceae bacterium]
MITIHVNTAKPYDVLIGNGLLDRAGELCAPVVAPCRACIVTDDTVAALYADRLDKSLTKAGYRTVRFVFPHGEESKSTEMLVALWEFLAEQRLTRSDCLFALGGGVVGDLCGFAAATYLRGIRFIQLPTTLLAAVDSSVGGKTAVDLRAGKNLVGAFHQPALVLCDPQTLHTLPSATFSDGCAEVVKYAVINDRPLFDRLASGALTSDTVQVIADCVQHKADIVCADEFDKGERQLLNLGHTIGHAVELCSGMQISHGSAVAIGTVTAMRASVALGLATAEELDELIALLSRLALPTTCAYTADELAKAALVDKKRQGDTVTLVLPYAIGDTRLYPIPVSSLSDFLQKGLTL